MRFTVPFRLLVGFVLWTMLAASAAGAGAKVHVITFGKWTSAQWLRAGSTEGEKPLTMKVAGADRGRAHQGRGGFAAREVTERLFVVRRAFRVNDSLADEATARWQWQRGGWLLVDRMTGRISAINLPEYDAFY